jgi:hypothetical protein
MNRPSGAATRRPNLPHRALHHCSLRGPRVRNSAHRGPVLHAGAMTMIVSTRRVAVRAWACTVHAAAAGDAIRANCLRAPSLSCPAACTLRPFQARLAAGARGGNSPGHFWGEGPGSGRSPTAVNGKARACCVRGKTACGSLVHTRAHTRPAAGCGRGCIDLRHTHGPSLAAIGCVVRAVGAVDRCRGGSEISRIVTATIKPPQGHTQLPPLNEHRYGLPYSFS